MPNWDKYKEAELNGTLTPKQTDLYEKAKKMGIVPQSQAPPPQEIAQTEQKPISFGEATIQGAKNLPKSLYGAMGDMLYTLNPMNWKEVAGAMTDAVLGAVEKIPGGRYMTPGPAYDIKGEPNKREMAVDALADHYSKTYGSWDGFKEKLAQDPANIFLDVATVALPASKAAGFANLTKTSKTLKTISEVTEPISLAMKVARQPFRLLPDKISESMYQSAVKFGTTLPAKERIAVTRTALAKQIMPTENGMKKLRGLIDDYNDQVNTKINRASMIGRVIPMDDLFKGLEPLMKTMKRLTDRPLDVDVAFNNLKKNWEASLDLGQMRTPTEVQKIKTQIYKDLAGFYEKSKATPARVELRKAVARNARESIEKIIPEIKQMNANEGELIELWDAIESKSNRITNRDFVSIGLPIKMGAGSGIGYMVGGPSGAAIGSAAGFMLGIYDTPQVKAKIALVLSKLKTQGIKIKPTALGTRLGLYQTKQVSDVVNEDQ